MKLQSIPRLFAIAITMICAVIVRAGSHEIDRETFSKGIFQVVFDGRKDMRARLWDRPVGTVISNANPEEERRVRALLEEFDEATGVNFYLESDPAKACVYIIFANSLEEMFIDEAWTRFKSIGNKHYYSLVEADLKRNIEQRLHNPFIAIGRGSDGYLGNAVVALGRSDRWKAKLAFGMAVAFGLAGTSLDVATVTALPMQYEKDDLQEFDKMALRFMYRHLKPSMVWADAQILIDQYYDTRGRK